MGSLVIQGYLMGGTNLLECRARPVPPQGPLVNEEQWGAVATRRIWRRNGR